MAQKLFELGKNDFISLLAASSPYLLELFLDHFHEAIVIMKPDYTISYANKAFNEVYNLSGLEQPEITRKKCYLILQGRDKPCDDIPCPVREALKSKSVEIVEQERHLPLGEKARIVQVAVPIIDEKKEVKYILKVVRRSSQAKNHELQSILEYIEHPVLVIDKNGYIKTMNKAFTKMIISLYGKTPRYIQIGGFDPERALQRVTEVRLKLDDACVKLRALTTRLKLSGEELYMLVISGLSKEVDEALASLSLRTGLLYYVVERKFEVSGAISQRLAGLLDCTAIVRSPNTELLRAAHCSLMELDKNGEVKPSINDVARIATEQLSRNRLLILEGLSYLAREIVLEETEKLIVELRGLSKTLDGIIIIISVNPSELNGVLGGVLIREAKHLEPDNLLGALHVSEKSVIKALCRERGKTLLYQNEIISLTGLSKPTVSKALEELERKGLVRVIRRGKLKYVELTEKGANYCFP